MSKLMPGNKPKKIDWITTALVVVAFGLVVLLGWQ